jgi:ribosomal protein L16/L10AE
LKLNTYQSITKKQKEVIIQYLSKKFKKKYVFLTKLHYIRLKTKKAMGTRMGQGTGKPEQQIYPISNTKLLIECYGNNTKYIINIFKRLRHKTSLNFNIKKRSTFELYKN